MVVTLDLRYNNWTGQEFALLMSLSLVRKSCLGHHRSLLAHQLILILTMETTYKLVLRMYLSYIQSYQKFSWISLLATTNLSTLRKNTYYYLIHGGKHVYLHKSNTRQKKLKKSTWTSRRFTDDIIKMIFQWSTNSIIHKEIKGLTKLVSKYNCTTKGKKLECLGEHQRRHIS